MSNAIKLSVTNVNNGNRLDVFITKNLQNFTRSYLKKLIKNRKVKVNGNVIIAPSTKIKKNDKIIVGSILKDEKK